MKRNIRKKRNALLKAFLCLTASAAFVLIMIPFTITLLFVPETDFPPKTDKAVLPEQKHISAPSSVKRIPVPRTICVYRKSLGTTETVPFEDYVKGVVSAEMPSSFPLEALKAQAVAARTYSLSKYLHAQKSGNPSAHSSAPVCDTVHCQVYYTKSQLAASRGASFMKKDWKKICAAVDSTKGQLLYYKGKLVEQALFHSSSGGKTENCEDVFSASVPYLVSVESPYESEATHQKETLTLSVSELTEKMKAAFPEIAFGTVTASDIRVLSRSKGSRVEIMQMGKGTVTGVQVRSALGLYSANFSIDIQGDTITFTTKGSGHGVGMSQYGASGMAKKGYDYKKILSHYYRGTVIL